MHTKRIRLITLPSPHPVPKRVIRSELDNGVVHVVGKIVAGEQQDLAAASVLRKDPEHFRTALGIAVDQGIIQEERRPRVGKERFQIRQTDDQVELVPGATGEFLV